MEPTPRVILYIWVTITKIVALVSILPWLGLAFCSLISYPSDDWSLSRILFTGIFYGYPFIIGGIVMFAQSAYKKGWNGWAWIASTVLIIPVIWFVFEVFKTI